MKERPILYSAPMVRPVLSGTKTQTRRIVRLQPDHRLVAAAQIVEKLWCWLSGHDGGITGKVLGSGLCPYGQPGDRLWVREAWRSGRLTDRFPPREMTPHPVWYEADGQAPDACNGKLRPGMFMPRWASRITLEVTGVRVERLQDISEADAIAEGLVSQVGRGGHTNWGLLEWGDNPSLWNCSPVQAYRALWNAINGSGAWDANPWVWVVEFKRI